MDQIIKFLLYGGETRETFLTIRPELVKSNRTAVLVLSLIAVLGMATMVLASFFVETLEDSRTSYLGVLAISIILASASLLAKKPGRASAVVTYTCVVAFVALFYAFGIVQGTIISPDAPSVSFPILLFAVPLVFVAVPIVSTTASILGILAYTAAALATQTPELVQYNLASIIPYGIGSIVIGSYLMRVKIRGLALERQNKHLIETDQLTGMLNRRSFEQHLQMLEKRDSIKGTMICALDVNGLKSINDSIGHHGGDELVIGAADAIQNVFGPYGRCYRIGGDEFIAILEGASPQVEELRDALNLRCSHFHGTFVSGLSVSMGAAIAQEGETVIEVARQADAAMYRDKTRYYLTNGRDRRRRA